MQEVQRVVVTGVSGFIAKHVTVKLLRAGFAVRGTVRNPQKARAVKQTIMSVCSAQEAGRLEFVQADLLSDEGWSEAMAGADAVMHIATAVPGREPKRAETVIRPALEGTERVLGHAVQAGIRRVVMTSSIAAIGYGHSEGSRVLNLTDKDWTRIEGLKRAWAYVEAKTLSEIKAWQIAERRLDLTVICPSVVFGPALDNDLSASQKAILRLLKGNVPALPPGGFSVVDVRDVAQMHVDALLKRESIGKRFISSAEFMPFAEISRVLQASYPDLKFPSATVPAWLLQVLGRFSATLRPILPDLKVTRYYDGSPGAKLMGRAYRSGQEATLSAAESLIELGLVELPSAR